MIAEFSVGSLRVSDNLPPIVVAEIGANHDGSVDKAHAMLDAVAHAGVKAVKFQFYTSAELVADVDRVTTWGPPHRRVRESVGAMFDRLSLPADALADLFSHATSLGIVPFATPFSEAGADRLASLGMACFKIAASDVTHVPLLEHVARLHSPVILSLGKCALADADRAISALMENGCPSLAILHCVATYPAPVQELNLRAIQGLRAVYPEFVVGFSDHSLGVHAAVAAVALGARIVEKHVTLDREAVGPDHWFSLNMAELAELEVCCRDTYTALGHPRKRVLDCEEQGRQKATSSIMLATAVRSGDLLTRDHLKITRPGTGLDPALLNAILGMRVCRNYPANTPVQWEMFK